MGLMTAIGNYLRSKIPSASAVAAGGLSLAGAAGLEGNATIDSLVDVPYVGSIDAVTTLTYGGAMLAGGGLAKLVGLGKWGTIGATMASAGATYMLSSPYTEGYNLFGALSEPTKIFDLVLDGATDYVVAGVVTAAGLGLTAASAAKHATYKLLGLAGAGYRWVVGKGSEMAAQAAGKVKNEVKNAVGPPPGYAPAPA